MKLLVLVRYNLIIFHSIRGVLLSFSVKRSVSYFNTNKKGVFLLYRLHTLQTLSLSWLVGTGSGVLTGKGKLNGERSGTGSSVLTNELTSVVVFLN